MTTTFRLFRAPLTEATNVREDIDCSFCGQHAALGFEIGIGADAIATCPACGALNPVDGGIATEEPCTQCAAMVDFPVDAEDPVVCPACLAAGRVAFTKDTELGMVQWDNAQSGWTHGLPGFSPAEWTTSAPDEEGWVRVQVDREYLSELVRTPGYPTIQGDRWLFCCRQPMVFLGEWSRERFTREAPDGDGKALFERVVQDVVPGLWEDQLHDTTGVYVFECPSCARRRAHWDMA